MPSAPGGPARTATCTWDPNGNLTDSGGTWTTGAGNWFSGSADTGWADGGNVAAFGWGIGGTAPCTVTLGSNITAGGLAFNNPNYTIAPDAGNIYGVTLDAGGITANASAAVNVPLAFALSNLDCCLRPDFDGRRQHSCGGKRAGGQRREMRRSPLR